MLQMPWHYVISVHHLPSSIHQPLINHHFVVVMVLVFVCIHHGKISDDKKIVDDKRIVDDKKIVVGKVAVDKAAVGKVVDDKIVGDKIVDDNLVVVDCIVDISDFSFLLFYLSFSSSSSSS